MNIYETLAGISVRLGECEQHAQLALQLGLQCKIGCAESGKLMMNHCWIEVDNTVIDLTQDRRFWHRREYYEEMRLRRIVTMSPEESIDYMNRAGIPQS